MSNTSWHTYPKVWALGHGAVTELFFDEVIIQEKIDGSQFSFGKFNGELKCRSKNQEMIVGAVEKMFGLAEDTIVRLKDRLIEGWTYRAEYLQKPKHNVLAYDRVPKDNLIIYDINTGEESYLSCEEVAAEANRLGLEVVPLLHSGKVTSAIDLEKLLEKTSILGGQKIEGFVCKNYTRFGKDKKALMGKFVSENFKEKHKKNWKDENPKANDIVQLLIDQYRTPARWDKAIQHLRERGELEGSPQDIGKIIKEVPKDLLEECEQEIKDQLFQWAFNSLIRGMNRGLAEYYKVKLFDSQFDNFELKEST